jgi:hypothetical protein
MRMRQQLRASGYLLVSLVTGAAALLAIFGLALSAMDAMKTSGSGERLARKFQPT